MEINFLYVVIFVICIVFIAATLLLAKLKRKLLKYIPLIIALSATVGFYVKAYFFSTSRNFEALGYFIFAMIAGGAAALSLLTAVIIEIVGYVKSQKKQ